MFGRLAQRLCVCLETGVMRGARVTRPRATNGVRRAGEDDGKRGSGGRAVGERWARGEAGVLDVRRGGGRFIKPTKI